MSKELFLQVESTTSTPEDKATSFYLSTPLTTCLFMGTPSDGVALHSGSIRSSGLPRILVQASQKCLNGSLLSRRNSFPVQIKNRNGKLQSTATAWLTTAKTNDRTSIS